MENVYKICLATSGIKLKCKMNSQNVMLSLQHLKYDFHNCQHIDGISKMLMLPFC